MAETTQEPVKPINQEPSIDIKTAKLNVKPSQDLENHGQPENLQLEKKDGKLQVSEKQLMSMQIAAGIKENIDREVMLIDTTGMNVLTRAEVIRRFNQKNENKSKVIQFPQAETISTQGENIIRFPETPAQEEQFPQAA